MTEIRLAEEYFPLVVSGRKRSTARRGKRHYELGEAVLRGKVSAIPVTITDLRHRRVSNLSDEDARRDGFATVREMRDALRTFYPELSSSDIVTIVDFEVR